MFSKKLFSYLLYSSLLFSANSYALDFNLEKLITDVATEVINNIPNQQSQNPSNTTPEARPEEIKTTGQTEPENKPSKKIQTADNSSTQTSSSNRIISESQCAPGACIAQIFNYDETEVCIATLYEVLDREIVQVKQASQQQKTKYRYKLKVLDANNVGKQVSTTGKWGNFKQTNESCQDYIGWTSIRATPPSMSKLLDSKF